MGHNMHYRGHNCSVPARHIYEGAAPCPYCLASYPIIQRPAPKKIKIKSFKKKYKM